LTEDATATVAARARATAVKRMEVERAVARGLCMRAVAKAAENRMRAGARVTPGRAVAMRWPLTIMFTRAG